jgi:hypothetical protein
MEVGIHFGHRAWWLRRHWWWFADKIAGIWNGFQNLRTRYDFHIEK